MRIHSDISIPPAVETGQAAKSSSQATLGSSGGAMAPDTSELSSGGANVLALAAAVNQLPDVRQERVAALAEQVRGGVYSPQPEESAAALMSFMLLPSAA